MWNGKLEKEYYPLFIPPSLFFFSLIFLVPFFFSYLDSALSTMICSFHTVFLCVNMSET